VKCAEFAKTPRFAVNYFASRITARGGKQLLHVTVLTCENFFALLQSPQLQRNPEVRARVLKTIDTFS
jgi:hypothetical protein